MHNTPSHPRPGPSPSALCDSPPPKHSGGRRPLAGWHGARPSSLATGLAGRPERRRKHHEYSTEASGDYGEKELGKN